jgi:EmrB/QacA subfamily drug resistance transporter
MSSAGLSPAVKRLAVVVVLGAFMSILDTTIVNVALETLSRDLDAPLDDVQWVATAYLLALAAVIPVTAWAARRVGSRKLYIWSLVLFTAGSALCGLAWNVESLVAFRVLQAIGGGMIMPVGQMVMARTAGPQNMGRVMAVIGVPIVMAPVLGPVLGGILVQELSWEWIFFVNVPVGIVAVLAAQRLFPECRSTTRGCARRARSPLACCSRRRGSAPRWPCRDRARSRTASAAGP